MRRIFAPAFSFVEWRCGRGLNWRPVLSALLNWSSAALLAAGLAVSQTLLGGWWYPALAVPGYLLVGAAAVLAGLLFWRPRGAPAAWCTGSVLLFGGYLLWRQSASPDPYAARDDTWLVLGALSVYLTAAWQLRGDGVRWLVLGTLIAWGVGQSVLVVVQFTAEAPFHPLADLVPNLRLPRGDGTGPNPGFVSGTLASRGSLSAVLQASTFLALGLLVWGRGGAAVKLLLLWATAAGFAGLTLCLSRSAYVGMAAGLAAFALVSFMVAARGAVAHRFWFAAGALVAVAVSLFLAFPLALESVAVRVRFDAMGLDAYRESLWFIVVPPMLALDPWFGTGANMFDQLSLRYRGASLAGWPVHAHNDWLQLLVEYGRAGFALGCLFFVVHFASGWRTALRLAREIPPAGWLPRSTELGLVTGSLAVLAAQGAHSFFDYRLHVQAAALPVALAAGWIAAARTGGLSCDGARKWPAWLLPLGLLPAVAGVLLLWSVGREARAEQAAFAAINAMHRGEPDRAWKLVREELLRSPRHPRLLVVAGESAGLLGNRATAEAERSAWYRQAASSFADAVSVRPWLPYAWREFALASDWSGRTDESLPWHLRAIGRQPDHARGYEYLALHFWKQGRHEEAVRLLRLAQRLPGSSLAREFLERIERERQASVPPGETF
jgi:tetratricopeptide (TPR) repeat protein